MDDDDDDELQICFGFDCQLTDNHKDLESLKAKTVNVLVKVSTPTT